MIPKRIVAGLAALGLTACGPVSESLDDQADRIARETIIADGHIDVPYRLYSKWADVGQATEDGDFDYPRALAGGLDAPFMSIYVPATHQVTGGAKELADELIDMVERIARAHPDKFALARSVADVEAAFAAGKIALPLGMENGAPIEGDLANLVHFHMRGIRYITLTHGKANHISDSSYDMNRPWGGLSPFGREVVRAMNDLGIMIDISHLSDDAIRDVLEVSTTPVIATHSSARHFTPGWERNLSDELIVAAAEKGGVVMVNFGSTFLTPEANVYGRARSAAYDAHLWAEGLEGTSELRRAFYADYAAEHGAYPYAALSDALDHFDHVVKLVGIDHVGIGSDYDGVGDSLPDGLKDVSTYPALIKGLLERGYSEADVKKILSGNLLRVWRAVEARAAD